MYKKIFQFLNLFIFLSIVVACSNKRPIEKNASESLKMPQIKTSSDLLIGRSIISEKTHVYIRQEQLPYFRTDTNSQRILLIGDSMSKWLRYRLGDYCQQNGHKLFTVTWVSGNTEWFSKYDTLNYYIKKEKISYVFLVLGANELFIKDFAKQRGDYVDIIVNKLSGVKWIWVGPPNWKKDKGINACLLEKLSNRKFFVSKDLKFKRQSDGMHPTVSSCSMWVDSIVQWINHTSTSRIKLNLPDSSFHLKPDAVLLAPLL